MPHISYQENEIADDESNYFLMEMDSAINQSLLNQTSEITIIMDRSIFWELAPKTPPNSSTIEPPFYCFVNDTVSSIEELDFNNLQKCSSITSKTLHKYIVVSYKLTNNVKVHTLKKSFKEWNEKKPRITFELVVANNALDRCEGKMIKIFNKEYVLEN